MFRPMTLVLWGSIISIVGALVGGTVVAIGKYRQDLASSKKSDTILLNTEEGLGLTKVTREDVKELIAQRDKLDNQVKELLTKQEDLKNSQDTLSERLEPFIKYAQERFPNVSRDEALKKLEELLLQQGKRLDKTDEKVGQIEKDVIAERDKIKPQLALENWTIKNQKVSNIPKRPGPSRDSLDIKKKFGLDHLIFNEIEFEYKTEVNRSEWTFVLNKQDVVHCLINVKSGVTNSQGVKTGDGKNGI